MPVVSGLNYHLPLPPTPRIIFFVRGVAQPGSALRSGRRGRRFESGHPDRNKNRMAFTMRFLFIDYPKYGLADDLFFLVHRLEDVQQIFAVKDVLLATELAADHRLPLMLKNPFQLLAP